MRPTMIDHVRVHEVCPKRENVPGRQRMQTVPLVASVVVEKVPAEQAAQMLEPNEGSNRPAGQPTHYDTYDCQARNFAYLHMRLETLLQSAHRSCQARKLLRRSMRSEQ